MKSPDITEPLQDQAYLRSIILLHMGEEFLKIREATDESCTEIFTLAARWIAAQA